MINDPDPEDPVAPVPLPPALTGMLVLTSDPPGLVLVPVVEPVVPDAVEPGALVELVPAAVLPGAEVDPTPLPELVAPDGLAAVAAGPGRHFSP